MGNKWYLAWKNLLSEKELNEGLDNLNVMKNGYDGGGKWQEQIQ